MQGQSFAGLTRLIGALWVVIAAVTVVLAVRNQPLSEWAFFDYLGGACVVLIGLAGAWALATGRGIVRSDGAAPEILRRRRTFAWLAMVLFSVFLVLNVLSDGTIGISAGGATGDILMTGLYVAVVLNMAAVAYATTQQLQSAT